MLPILLHTKWLTLYSYPLVVGMAFGLGHSILRSLLEKHKLEKSLNTLFWGIVASAWLGAKLVFLLVSAKEQLEAYSMSLSFWMGGGLVFYGGFIGALVFCLIYSFVLKKFPPKKLSLLLIPLTFSHALGRVGCLLAGCCYGIETNVAWAIHLHDKNRHPVQLYESIGLLVLAIVLLNLERKNKSNLSIIATYFLGYSILRFVLEFFRGDKIRGIFAYGLSTSQFISLGLAMVGGILIALQFFYLPNPSSDPGNAPQ